MLRPVCAISLVAALAGENGPHVDVGGTQLARLAMGADWEAEPRLPHAKHFAEIRALVNERV